MIENTNSKRMKILKRVMVIIGFIACNGILVFNAMLSMRFPGGVMLGDVNVSVSGLLGTLQAFTFLVCILMVRSGIKMGYVLSIVALIGSLMGCVRATITAPDHASLPGIFSGIVFLVAITIIFRKLKELSLRANTELVTGLLNRRGVVDRMENYIDKGIHFDFVSITIDNFNSFNSYLGFISGDLLFKELGSMIKAIVSEEASGVIVGTFDRSTFVLLMPENSDNIHVISDLIHRITQPITIVKEGTPIECRVTAYAGMATFPDHTQNIEEVIKYSDLAMRHCCKVKKHFFEVFNDGLKDSYLRENYIEQVIKYGIDNESIYMVYQPFFDIKDKSLKGFEALARLEDSQGTLLDATEFVSVAEKSDLIVHFDKYVIKHTLADLAMKANDKNSFYNLSINISAKSMDNIGMVDFIFECLHETQFPKECLIMEITEYSFKYISDTIKRNMEALASGGVKVAVDDFGTGYTSLSHLVQIPLSILKIDREIVSGIEFDRIKRDIVNSVISIGHVLGCQVVCEGVETERQIDILRETGCDIVQGFIWGRPVTYDDAMQMLREDLSRREAIK